LLELELCADFFNHFFFTIYVKRKNNSHRMELLQDLVLGCTKVTVEGTHNWYHKLLLSLWSLVLSDLNLGNLYSFHAWCEHKLPAVLAKENSRIFPLSTTAQRTSIIGGLFFSFYWLQMNKKAHIVSTLSFPKQFCLDYYQSHWANGAWCQVHDDITFLRFMFYCV
jgi:hypothetical protein